MRQATPCVEWIPYYCRAKSRAVGPPSTEKYFSNAGRARNPLIVLKVVQRLPRTILGWALEMEVRVLPNPPRWLARGATMPGSHP
jgi:hypothetical protein